MKKSYVFSTLSTLLFCSIAVVSAAAQPESKKDGPAKITTSVVEFNDLKITPITRSVPVGNAATFQIHYSGTEEFGVYGCDGTLSADSTTYTIVGAKDCTITVGPPKDDEPDPVVKTVPTPDRVVLSGVSESRSHLCTWLNPDGTYNRIPNWSRSEVKQVSGEPASAYKVNWRTFNVVLPTLAKGDSMLEFRCYAPDKYGVIWPSEPVRIHLLAHPVLAVKRPTTEYANSGLFKPVHMRSKSGKDKMFFAGRTSQIDEVGATGDASLVKLIDHGVNPAWMQGVSTPASVRHEHGKWNMWVNGYEGFGLAESSDGVSWKVKDVPISSKGNLKKVVKKGDMYFLYYQEGINLYVGLSLDGKTIETTSPVILFSPKGGYNTIDGFAVTRVIYDGVEYFLALVSGKEKATVNGSAVYYVSTDGIHFETRWRTAFAEIYESSKVPVEDIVVNESGTITVCSGHRRRGNQADRGHVVCAERSLPERVFQPGAFGLMGISTNYSEQELEKLY